jgi:hypothetical protein
MNGSVLSCYAKRIAPAFLFLQGLLTVAWWQWIAVAPEMREYFFASGSEQAAIDRFAAPDLLVLALGSVATSLLALCNSRFAPVAAWLVAGAAMYACVGAISVNWPVGSVPFADGLMILAVVNSLLCALMIGKSAR